MIRLLRVRFAAVRKQGPVVAELKPVQPTEGISLSRWSRLKRAAAEEQAAASTASAAPVEAIPASATGNDAIGPDGKSDSAANAEYDELPPMSGISLAEDFTPFMQAKVPQAVKQQALKALFKEPHFNVMDGLDIYIDDYTVFEPISPEVMATLSSWKTIMNPPQQVVTNGGYAVDVESEEGKAVLAARAELAQANAALQPVVSAVQVPSPAARSDRHVAPGSGAEGEGDGVQNQTSQTIQIFVMDDTSQLSDEANATALTPNLSRAAGEGANQHIRYGKRVGDFSASAHEAAEDATCELPPAELVETPSTAPKSTT
jgi:hypothetical protein